MPKPHPMTHFLVIFFYVTWSCLGGGPSILAISTSPSLLQILGLAWGTWLVLTPICSWFCGKRFKLWPASFTLQTILGHFFKWSHVGTCWIRYHESCSWCQIIILWFAAMFLPTLSGKPLKSNWITSKPPFSGQHPFSNITILHHSVVFGKITPPC